ncbi:MAG: LapA family protein [Pseudomonadales bacterium]
MASLRWLAFVIFAIVVLIFGMLAVNQESVSLRLLDWQTPEISVFFWLLAAFAIGLSAGVVGMMLSGVKHRLERRKLNKSVETLRKEVATLKNLAPQET